MGQLTIEGLMGEPTEIWEYLVLFLFIFFFGIFFARIGRMLLGISPAETMFRGSLAIKEHKAFGAGCKLAFYTIGQDCGCWFFLVGGAASYFGNDWRVVACAIPVSILFIFLPPHTAVEKNRGKVFAAIGIGGFILALLYLKCGGWGDVNPRKALLCASIAHLWTTGIIANAYRKSQR
jgi:hypothetical protein